MAKQKTKKEYLTQIKEILKDYPEIVKFCEKEIELLIKKNSSSGTSKTAIENAKIMDIIVVELANIAKPITITELMQTSEVIANYTLESGDKLTNQKISALMKKLCDPSDGRVVNTKDKKKSLFSVASV